MNTKTTYTEKLRDPRWQKKRLEIFERDNFCCRSCWDEKTTLCVHHLKYKGNPWDSPLSDLVTLCDHCHSIIEYAKKSGTDLPINGLTQKYFFTKSEDHKLIFINKKGVSIFYTKPSPMFGSWMSIKTLFDIIPYATGFLNFNRHVEELNEILSVIDCEVSE